MARTPRHDTPGSVHHVFNRGIARRTVFETRRDVRYFCSLLARQVRAGRLRVHGFSFLTTHFHLSLESPLGELSDSLRHVMNQYVRYFNRTRRRDGPLFRGRFGSRVVRSETYRTILVRYIDQNAPQARLADAAAAYPYGSAAYHVRTRRPRWLCSTWIDRRLGDPEPSDRMRRYRETFGAACTVAEATMVGARMRRAPSGEDDLDDLVIAAPSEVRAWLRRKARLADGTLPGQVYVTPAVVDNLVRIRAAASPRWLAEAAGRREDSGWPVALTGVLRFMCGLSHRELARWTRASEPMVRRRLERHDEWMASSTVYADGVAALAHAALRTLTTDRRRSGE